MNDLTRKSVAYAIGALVLAGAVGGFVGGAISDHHRSYRGGDSFERAHMGMMRGYGRPGFTHARKSPTLEIVKVALRDHLKVKDADLKKALLASVDDLKKDGTLSTDQAKRMSTRIEEDSFFAKQ